MYQFIPASERPSDALNSAAAALGFLSHLIGDGAETLTLDADDRHGFAVILSAISTTMTDAASGIGGIHAENGTMAAENYERGYGAGVADGRSDAERRVSEFLSQVEAPKGKRGDRKENLAPTPDLTDTSTNPPKEGAREAGKASA